jgi:hypothetical protein
MAALLKMHINRNTARSIVHGPLLYGGMELPNLYALQGTRQLQFLIGHLRASDKTGNLILIAHGYIQLLVGIQSNFLNANYK